MDLNKSIKSFFNTLIPLFSRKVLDVDNAEICDTGYKSENVSHCDNWRVWGKMNFYWVLTPFFV